MITFFERQRRSSTITIVDIVATATTAIIARSHKSTLCHRSRAARSSCSEVIARDLHLGELLVHASRDDGARGIPSSSRTYGGLNETLRLRELTRHAAITALLPCDHRVVELLPRGPCALSSGNVVVVLRHLVLTILDGDVRTLVGHVVVVFVATVVFVFIFIVHDQRVAVAQLERLWYSWHVVLVVAVAVFHQRTPYRRTRSMMTSICVIQCIIIAVT
mmetsp:Transcript_19506/g.46806  ORF Transcript_19506/g.46806 Transcript_19506/m.46806 type:complete len:219 (+) Transcript_19506:1337-1993(+)